MAYLREARRSEWRKLPGLSAEKKEEMRKVLEHDVPDSDDEDLLEVRPIFGKKHDPFWYVEKCAQLAKENKVILRMSCG